MYPISAPAEATLSRVQRFARIVIAGLAGVVLAGCVDVGVLRKDHPKHHRIYGFANPSGQDGTGPVQFLVDRTRLALTGRAKTRAPVLEPETAAAKWQATGQADAVQWLGHAAVRLRLSGMEILVDPVFAPKVTPVLPFGPPRSSKPPVPLDDFTDVDAILISHNHYDHFEPDSIARISANGAVRCLLPLKVAGLHKLNCSVTSLDWDGSTTLGPIRATFLQSLHESGRGMLDRNFTLWGSWLLQSGRRRVYVHGDGGYGPQFKAAGRRAGGCGVDLAVFSVGGYEPAGFNRDIHMSPEEAIQAAHDLCAKRVLIVHWGTYPLGLETNVETLRRLRAAARDTNLPKGVLVILPVGDTMRF